MPPALLVLLKVAFDIQDILRFYRNFQGFSVNQGQNLEYQGMSRGKKV